MKQSQITPKTTQRCQVLYDLRDVSAWISGTDLHEIFRDLVDDPSPSGKILYDERKARKIIKNYDKLINEKHYTVIVGSVTWFVHKEGISIKEASELRFKIYRHLNAVEQDIRWSVCIIPNEFGFVMSGNSVIDFDFSGGSLQISRYAQEKTRPMVNYHVISSRKEKTANHWHLWHNLGLKDF